MNLELSDAEQKEAEDWRIKKCGKKGFNDLKRKFHKDLKKKERFPEVKDENKALYTR